MIKEAAQCIYGGSRGMTLPKRHRVGRYSGGAGARPDGAIPESARLADDAHRVSATAAMTLTYLGIALDGINAVRSLHEALAVRTEN